jgi:hypothetical protein
MSLGGGALRLLLEELCLEPLARGVVGMLSPHPFVWWVEIATGVVVGVSFIVVIVTSRRSRETVPPPSPAA